MSNISAPTDSTSLKIEKAEASPSRLKRISRIFAWTSLGIFLLLFFTLLKLPEDRLRNYIQGMLSSQLANQGMTLTARQSAMSIGMGVSYSMQDVTLSPAPPQDPIKIEQLSVSPSFIPMLLGRVGGSARIDNRGGTIKTSYSQSISTPSAVKFSFSSSNMDLGSIGVLPLLANVKGSAIVNGDGNINGDTNVPTTLEGQVHLDLSKIVIDAQTLMGFSVPRLTVSEGKVDIVIEKGKAVIKSLSLSKPGNATDDIRAAITGDATLGKNWNYSTLNLKADFSLSQNVLKSFIILDAILGQAKQADGSYIYNITGTVGNPSATPVAAAGGGAAPSTPGGK